MCDETNREYCKHIGLLVPPTMANLVFNSGESPFGCLCNEKCSRYPGNEDGKDCWTRIEGSEDYVIFQKAMVDINNLFFDKSIPLEERRQKMLKIQEESIAEYKRIDAEAEKED